ncbi:MAG: AraC family transcriptional regulator [Cyanobacteria bacterium]|nr:AraC family transcriptional regulator [Cyanobacteriota bacterium]
MRQATAVRQTTAVAAVDAWGMPLLEPPQLAMTSHDAVFFGGVLDQVLPVKVATWDALDQHQPFFNKSAAVQLGDLSLLSTFGSGFDGSLERRGQAHLVLPYAPELAINDYKVEGRTYRFQDDGLFLSQEESQLRIHASFCAAVVFTFPPESLIPVAASMAGSARGSLAIQAALQRTTVLDRRRDRRLGNIQSLLKQSLQLIHGAMAASSGSLNPMLQLDDLVRRLLVMLLLPQLLHNEGGAPGGNSATPGLDLEARPQDPFSHDALVQWMLANLQQPISLSDIERRSCYSRRSLQYAFRQRYGCGPTQWLRRQRLERAHSILSQPRPGLTVNQVSQDCGYLSQAAFSRDFLRRFGQKPSEVLRQQRLCP